MKRLQALPPHSSHDARLEMQSPIIELDFNTQKKPFDNAKVRQAVAYAIDRQFVIDNIWFGFGSADRPHQLELQGNRTLDRRRASTTTCPTGSRANKLLDEAGYKRAADGTRFEITHDITPYGEEWRRFGEYVQQQLGKLGIKVNLRYEDVPTWLRRVYTNYDYELTNNWIQTLADPVIGVHRLYHSKLIKPGTVFVNGTRWSSPETDKLMDQATVEPDPKRAAAYHEMQKGGRSESDRVRDGTRLCHGAQQAVARLAGEPAWPVLVVRSGLAREVDIVVAKGTRLRRAPAGACHPDAADDRPAELRAAAPCSGRCGRRVGR